MLGSWELCWGDSRAGSTGVGALSLSACVGTGAAASFAAELGLPVPSSARGGKSAHDAGLSLSFQHCGCPHSAQAMCCCAHGSGVCRPTPSIRFSSTPCTKPQGSRCNILPPPRFQCPNLSSQPPHPPRGSQPPQPRHSPLHAPGLLSPLSPKVADALSRDPLCVVPGLVSHGSRFAPRPVYPRSTCSRHHRPASAFPRERRRARPRGGRRGLTVGVSKALGAGTGTIRGVVLC